MTIRATTARRILRRQGMPSQEIRAVLAADDPLLGRRLLELHRERLGERLEEQRMLVGNIEQALADGPVVLPRGRVNRVGLSEVAAG